jgi:protein-tyrosine phosphatase
MTGWPSGRSRDGGIDEIPLPGVPGRLWLCGKHAVGPDVEAALERVGATRVVCLSERHELADRYGSYVDWLEAHRGTRAHWFPTPDLHALPVARMGADVGVLVAELRAGSGVLAHCGAGIGRAGTLAAAILIELGVSLERALAVVAEHRPMAGPEAGEQRLLLEEFARLSGRRAVGSVE